MNLNRQQIYADMSLLYKTKISELMLVGRATQVVSV